MQMDAGLDTGDMLAKAVIDIDADASAGTLHDQLKQVGAELLLQQLPAIEQGTIQPRPQVEQQACYAPKLSKQEALIDWHKNAATLEREVRAFNPWPVSYSYLDNQPVKIWSAQSTDQACSLQPGQILMHDRDAIHVCCGDGVLRISELQLAGKKRTTAAQLLNARDLSGASFANPE